MKNEEFSQMVNTLSEEIKQRLLFGNFSIVGCFSWEFTDKYELDLSGARLFICINSTG